MELENRVAVITGAGSGIGRATALRMASAGARVVVADMNHESAAETARLVADRGAQPLPWTVDVAKPEQVTALFAQIDHQHWPIDILINNAGNSGHLVPLEQTKDEDWQHILDVHLNGTFFCTREALRRMIPRGRGTIVNLGSVAGLGGMPGAAAYTAAKGGIISLTKGLSQEVARYGIRVNCVAPGWIDTPILENVPDAWRPKMLQNTPLARLGRPEEVAEVIFFLASDASSFMTGQILSPNGGMYR